MRCTALLLSLALSACPSLRLAAQESAPVTGGIRGTVYDSLLRQPLAGATVWIEGASRTITDNRGRFRLTDIAPGEWLLQFANPDLDTLGVPQFSRQVTVVPGQETRADLAVPSLATMYQHLCGRRLPTASHGTPLASIMVGTILDAESGRRVSQARVQASWLTADSDGPPYFGRASVRATTDSVGGFVLCGLPVGQSVSMMASAGAGWTGIVDVHVTARRLAVQNLYVSLDSAETDLVSGLQRGHAVVMGLVVGAYGPLGDAELAVEGSPARYRTGPDGRFVLDRLPPGSQVLMTRSIGYGALRRVVHLRGADTVRLTVELRRLTTLDTIRIVGHRNPDVSALLQRLELGAGYAMVGDRLLSAQDVPTLLGTVPGLAVDGPPSIGCSPGTRNDAQCFKILKARGAAGYAGSRECRARIWVDGHPSSEIALGMMQPTELVAVEWFGDAANLPSRYVNTQDCALLLVWTRALR